MLSEPKEARATPFPVDDWNEVRDLAPAFLMVLRATLEDGRFSRSDLNALLGGRVLLDIAKRGRDVADRIGEAEDEANNLENRLVGYMTDLFHAIDVLQQDRQAVMDRAEKNYQREVGEL